MSGQDFRREMKSSEPNAVIIGDQVLMQGLTAGSRLFIFSRPQMQFLLALQKLKAVLPAAMSVNQTEEWALNFLKSRKFKSYLAEKMQEFSIKNGMTVEWWYQFGKWLTEGKKTFYEGVCPFCTQMMILTPYEAESFRQDDMSLKAECPACFKAVQLTDKTEDFKPTREQVEGWKEIGSRLIAKVERVHHSFDKSEFVFESEGEEIA